MENFFIIWALGFISILLLYIADFPRKLTVKKMSEVVVYLKSLEKAAKVEEEERLKRLVSIGNLRELRSLVASMWPEYEYYLLTNTNGNKHILSYIFAGAFWPITLLWFWHTCKILVIAKGYIRWASGVTAEEQEKLLEKVSV